MTTENKCTHTKEDGSSALWGVWREIPGDKIERYAADCSICEQRVFFEKKDYVTKPLIKGA